MREFNFKNKAKGAFQSQCKVCTRKQVMKHYYKNKEYYLLKAKNRNKLIREKNRKYVWNYLLQHPCIDCGEKDIIVLTFDHIGRKRFNISDTARWRFGLNSLKKEMAKCEIRCANCHLRKTAKQFGWKKHGLVA